jgi:hypothetical protein
LRIGAKKITPISSQSQKIEALISCHAENPIAKFWGVCNDVKADLVK